MALYDISDISFSSSNIDTQDLSNDIFLNTNMETLQYTQQLESHVISDPTTLSTDKLKVFVGIVLKKIQDTVSSLGVQLKQIIIQIIVNKNTFFAHSDDVNIGVFAKSEDTAIDAFIELFKNPKYNKT